MIYADARLNLVRLRTIAGNEAFAHAVAITGMGQTGIGYNTLRLKGAAFEHQAGLPDNGIEELCRGGVCIVSRHRVFGLGPGRNR